jgi:glycerophosphoryl diester phosphodiesterase
MVNMKICPIVLCVFLTCFACKGGGIGSKLSPVWPRPIVVAHALGAIDGHTYTNSLEAFDLSYRRGHRCFEVDLAVTADNVVVARHDWEPRLATLLEQSELEHGGAVSVEDFSHTRINHRYTPLTLREIAILMRTHPATFVITDTKSPTPEAAARDFGLVVRTFKQYAPEALPRLVPQIYSEEMLGPVRAIYDFPFVIYTLYMTASSDDQVVRFAQANRITAVTMTAARFSPGFGARLRAVGVDVYVHTINSAEKARELRKLGVQGLYSDELIPSDLSSE